MTEPSSPTPASLFDRHRVAFLAVFVLLVGFAAHVTSVAGGFVYDDHRFIELNESIRTIDVAAFFTEAATTSHGQGIEHDIYRPLRTLLFSFEYALFGTNPTGWHAVSLFLHLTNAVLVFVVLRSWIGNGIVSAAGASLFAVHPATVESVAWVSSQGDLLALTFMLAALYVFRRRGLSATILGVALFALACFSKESALVLPALVFLQDLVLRGREASAPTAPSWRTTWTRIGVMAAMIVVYFVMRQSVVSVLAQVGHPGDSVWASVRGMLASLVWYANALVAPHGFAFEVRLVVPLDFGDPHVVVGLGLLLSALLLGLWGLFTRHYVVALAALGFLACLVPVSNVIVPLKTFAAERFLYPGLVCLAAGVSALVVGLRGTARHVALGVIAVVLIWFAIVSADRTSHWQDETSLWNAVLTDRPTNPDAYLGIAFAHHETGRVKVAERALETYLGFNRVDGKAWKLRGDNFGKAAELLVYDAASGEQTDIDEKRNMARRAQIAAYRTAIEIWDSWDLTRGRGSPALRRSMLLQWMDAAAELGDPVSQKWANDRLLADDGVDPTDVEAVWTTGRWPRRFARLRIAFQVVRGELRARPDDPEGYNQALRQRAAVLEDARLDPHQPNDRLRPVLAGAIVEMFEEAVDVGRILPPIAWEQFARELATIDRLGDALRILDLAVRQHPDHAGTRQLQSTVRDRVEGPGGGRRR